MRQTQLLPRMLFILVFVLILTALVSAQTQASNRITQAADDQQVSRMRGNVHPLLAGAADKGRVDGSTRLNRVTLTFKRSAAQQKALDALLDDLQNSNSPNYHKWLTPEQFGQRFGLSDADLAKVSGWLQSHGMKIVDVARGRDYIAFSGTASQIAAAFHTDLHQYVVDGETHFANASEPSIPAAFADVVGSVSLNNFRPRPRARTLRSKFTSSISGNHFVAPEDFATIYNVKGLYNAGITGTGQKIAVVGQSDINLSDIRAFRTAAGLPANDPVKTLIPGSTNPGIKSGDITESNLDIEWSGAVAKNAQISYIFSTNVFNSMQYAIDQNVAPVISISYGDCEPNFSSSDLTAIVSMAQKANAQGQTIVGPAGDDAATDCDYSTGTLPTTIARNGLQVDVPASLPYVTAIGGTSFNEGSGNFWNPTNTAGGGSALSYIPELGWNDTAVDLANGGSITGTGGGASRLFSKPAWQTGTGVPNDGARDLPDISFNASVTHDGFLICSEGSCTNGFRDANNNLFAVGGTSAGVPVFAGVVALLNQQTGTSQGNLNPKLYALAASTPAAFHDITNGDNKAPCLAGTRDCPSGGSIGYIAGPGYDLVTGLGSIDASALAAVWNTAPAPTADFHARTDNAIVQLARGASANVVLTVSPSNGFTGTVTITCSVPTSLGTTTCTPNPTSIATSGTSTITIRATSVADAGHKAPLSHRGWAYGSVFAFAFGLVFTGSKRRRMFMMITLVALALMLLGWSGCGGGNSSSGGGGGGGGSTPLNGTVTVHMVSGSIVHDSHITVEIN